MTGFPLQWEDDRLGPSPDGDGWPVSAQAIASYLDACAYHYLKDEPPLTYGPLTQVLHRVVEQREFWILTCTDRNGAPWFVVVSSGPSEPRRWLFAESQDGRTAERMLQDALDELPRGAGA